MERIFQVELSIIDKTGCPLGTERESVLATKESETWSILRPNPHKDEIRGTGSTQREAVVDWLYKNEELLE